MRKFQPIQIRWGEELGNEGEPYLKRWVFNFHIFAIRIHHWISSDDDRALHDHAWDFVTIVLSGSYYDVREDGQEWLQAGAIKFRKAEHKHWVKVPSGGCWTLLLTGPKKRNWGFWVPGRSKLMRPLRYFSRYGHH